MGHFKKSGGNHAGDLIQRGVQFFVLVLLIYSPIALSGSLLPGVQSVASEYSLPCTKVVGRLPMLYRSSGSFNHFFVVSSSEGIRFSRRTLDNGFWVAARNSLWRDWGDFYSQLSEIEKKLRSNDDAEAQDSGYYPPTHPVPVEPFDAIHWLRSSLHQYREMEKLNGPKLSQIYLIHSQYIGIGLEFIHKSDEQTSHQQQFDLLIALMQRAYQQGYLVADLGFRNVIITSENEVRPIDIHLVPRDRRSIIASERASLTALRKHMLLNSVNLVRGLFGHATNYSVDIYDRYPWLKEYL